MENGSTGQMRSSNPPPACGALWRMPQLGKCARATPRQAAGRVVPGPANLGSESGLTERRTLRFPDRAECAFPSRCDRRMRLSVRVLAQNALFRRMHLSSPGQTWRRLTEKHILQPTPHGKAHSATYTSRKSTLCHLRLTEKHTLPPAPHGKAHSAIPRSRRMRLSVTLRRPGGVGQPPPLGCGALWRMPQLGKRARATPRQPAGRLARGSADLGLGLTSRKSALCPTGGFRMRFSVTMRPQNALFRHDVTAECAFP